MVHARRWPLRNAFVLIATLALAAALPTAALGSGGPTVKNYQVNQAYPGPFPTNQQQEPSLAANPKNALNLIAGANDEIGQPACTDTNPSNCGFVPKSVAGYYASFDGGKTWPCQGLIDLGSLGIAEIASGDPSQTFDSQGNAFFGTLALPFPVTSREVRNGFPADFVVAKSTDGGCTYTSATVISGNSPAAFDDKDAIAADANPSSPYHDNVYAAWTIFNKNAATTGTGKDQIVFSRSTDGGKTWSKPNAISPANANAANVGREGAAVKVGPDGSVYVSWLDVVDKTAAIRITVSHDGGKTFPSAPVTVATVSDDLISPLPGTSFRDYSRPFPALGAASDGAVYVAWGNHQSGHGVALLAVSHDGAQTWSAPMIAGDVPGRTPFFVALTNEPSGAVDVAFSAVDNVPFGTVPGAGVVYYDTYLSRSTDGGTTFAPPLKISTASSDPDVSSSNSLDAQFIGDYISAAADATHVYVAWTDSRNGSTCDAVDAYRTGQSGAPNVIAQCPKTFGNTDIFLGTITP